MHAVVVSAFGGPEVLTEAELADPEPGPGQITIDTSHLVVHDIGGRIGFERATTHPERVLSLTVLNSPVDVAVFRRPWSMHPSPSTASVRHG
jgi:pimeloyl-ACP methyl ester carboxylesterase